jgi:hypothetical protein
VSSPGSKSRRHLYLQLYLFTMGTVVVCFLLAGLSFRWLRFDHEVPDGLQSGVERLMEDLSTQSGDDFVPALLEKARLFNVQVALWDADQQLIAASHDTPLGAFPYPLRAGGYWHEDRQVVVVKLNDGRVFGAVGRRHSGQAGLRLLVIFVGVALVVALTSYLLMRRVIAALSESNTSK